MSHIFWNGLEIKLYDLVAEVSNHKKERHLAELLLEHVQNHVWSIINHNDALSNDELKNLSDRTDNDKNVVHVCKALQEHIDETQLQVKRVIYLTNTNGLLDNDGNTIIGWIISWEEDKNQFRAFVKQERSKSGTGGMLSKVNWCFDALAFGAQESYIAFAGNGLECLYNTHSCTKFTKN